MTARGWKLVGVGALLLVAAFVLWLALGGFQTGAYGGITNEQQATMDRANRFAGPVFLAGLAVGVVGVGHLAAAALRRLMRR